MALVSVKNFMVPLTNKVHLGTIVFAVVLFAAFRAAGGAISVGGTSTGVPVYDEDQDLPVEESQGISNKGRGILDREIPGIESLTPANEGRRLGIVPRDDREQDDLIEGALNEGSGKNAAGAGQDRGRNLDDIERRLGLR